MNLLAIGFASTLNTSHRSFTWFVSLGKLERSVS